MSSPVELATSPAVCNGNPGVMLFVNESIHLLTLRQAEWLALKLADSVATAQAQAARLAVDDFKIPASAGERRARPGGESGCGVKPEEARAEADAFCAFCGELAQGNHAIHRDGMGDGPEVPLCDTCGSQPTPTCEEIWARTAQPDGGK